MKDALLDRPFPRGALIGAAGLVLFALVAAGAARLTGVGVTPMPVAAAVDSRVLRFEDRADGAVIVLAEPGRQLVEVLPPDSNGFVRGVLRSLVRERKRESMGDEVPFRLTRWADGRMTLEDPATGQHIGLEAFGHTNFAVFARMLQAGKAES